MTLDAAAFPLQYLLGYTFNGEEGGGGRWYDDGDLSYLTCSAALVQNLDQGDSRRRETSVASPAPEAEKIMAVAAAAEAEQRRKRKRTRRMKNEEEKESQRMVHIAVERNRRRKMNEYLAVLRSLTPPSYAQRGDQASIVGGAINYVKELQQLLISLQLNKRLLDHKQQQRPEEGRGHGLLMSSNSSSNGPCNESPSTAAKWAAVADVEVSIVESHANLKVVVSGRRPKQLSKLLASLQNVRLSPLHLNVATADQMVVYSFTLKVEDDCPYSSADEIAAAAHEIIGRTQDEAKFP